MTLLKDVEELLKRDWFSNYQMQMILHSSSADRAARIVRQNPPEGYVMKQRIKENSKVRCFEYKLVRTEE